MSGYSTMTMTKTMTNEAAPGTEFDGVVNLFSDPVTADQYDRQLSVMNKLLVKVDALYIQSGLKAAPACVHACIERIRAGRAEFNAPLVGLLNVMAKPLKWAKSQDTLYHTECVFNCLDAAAHCLDSDDDKTREAASRTIEAIVSAIRDAEGDDLSHMAEAKSTVPTKMNSSTMSMSTSGKSALSSTMQPKSGSSMEAAYDKRSNLHSAVKDSCIVEKLTEQIRKEENEPPVEIALVRALREASHYAHNCQKIENQGCLTLLFRLLEVNDFRSQQTFLAMEVIWNVLELHPSAKETLGNYHTIGILKDVLKNNLIHGYRLKDKEFRNDCLVVCSLLADDSINHPYFHTTGLIELLVVTGCGTELGIEHEALKPFMQTIAEEDFELKKLSWNILYTISFHQPNAEYLLEAGVLHTLFHFIDIDCNVPEVVRWPTLQLLDLQYQALNIIAQLALHGPTQFAEANGAPILLGFLAECMDLNLRNTTLRVLVQLANSENRGAFVEAQAIEKMLILICNEVDLDVKRDCLQVIGDLCAGSGIDQDQAREHFYHGGGVDILVPYLDLTVNSMPSQRLMYTIVDTVWNGIVPNAQNQQRFLELKGMQKLLDALARTPAWIQLPLVTCLVDFFESPDAVTQAVAWTHKASHTPIQKLLIGMWATAMGGPEEPTKAKLLAEEHANQGDINTAKISFSMREPPYVRALNAGHLKPQQAFAGGAQNTMTEVAPKDLLEESVANADLKTKIFCLFSKIGFQGHDSLDYQERSYLPEIECYLDTRKDKMWNFVTQALAEEGCRPTSPDQAHLDKDRKQRDDTKARIATEQKSWREKSALWLQEDEQVFYKTLIKKSEDKEAERKHQPGGLTITQAKIRKAQMLKASFKATQSPEVDANLLPVPTKPKAAADTSPKTAPKSRNAPSSAPTASSPGFAADRELGFGAPPTAPAGITLDLDGGMDALDTFMSAEDYDAVMPSSVRAFADRTPANLGGTEGQQFLTTVEYSLFLALKALRKDPASWVPKMERLRDMVTEETQEDDTADVDTINESFSKAIDKLKNTQPMKPLKNVPMGLTLAARDLALGIGMKGDAVINDPHLECANRASRYGHYDGNAVDCMAFGRRSADEIIGTMLLDNYLHPSGQFAHLLDPSYRYVGIGVGWHRLYRYVAVLTCATMYKEAPRTKQLDNHNKFVAVTMGRAGLETLNSFREPETPSGLSDRTPSQFVFGMDAPLTPKTPF